MTIIDEREIHRHRSRKGQKLVKIYIPKALLKIFRCVHYWCRKTRIEVINPHYAWIHIWWRTKTWYVRTTLDHDMTVCSYTHMRQLLTIPKSVAKRRPRPLQIKHRQLMVLNVLVASIFLRSPIRAPLMLPVRRRWTLKRLPVFLHSIYIWICIHTLRSWHHSAHLTQWDD